MGLFDFLQPTTPSSTNAPSPLPKGYVEASHILFESKEQAATVQSAIEAGEISFEDAALAYSKCPTASRSEKNGMPQNGRLGSFRGLCTPPAPPAPGNLAFAC
jgi:hypothetical protein